MATGVIFIMDFIKLTSIRRHSISLLRGSGPGIPWQFKGTWKSLVAITTLMGSWPSGPFRNTTSICFYVSPPSHSWGIMGISFPKYFLQRHIIVVILYWEFWVVSGSTPSFTEEHVSCQQVSTRRRWAPSLEICRKLLKNTFTSKLQVANDESEYFLQVIVLFPRSNSRSIIELT